MKAAPVSWTKSLRFQLTVWSLATTAMILLAASVLCLSLVRLALQRETDQALQETASSLLRHMVPEGTPKPRDTSPDSLAQSVRTARLAAVTLPGVGRNTLCLRLVRAGTGQTAALSPTLAEQPGLQAVLAALPAKPHPPMFAGTTDDTQLRCLAVPVPQTPFLLQVATPWDPVEDLMTELLLGLLLASLLFLLLFGIGSALLVGRALRPIDRIVSEAEALTPDRLGTVQLSSLSDTEIGHLIAALNRMLGRIAGSFSAQRQFTADASHELRTPLTILRGQFELALSRPRSAAEYRAAVESGLEEILRMTRIVESLAYLARGDAAGSPTRLAPVSLAVLAGEVVHAQQSRAAAKDLHLSAEASSPAILSGDSDALRRLVQNLVENAVSYTPAGGKIVICVSETARHCCLSVTDTGVGIAREDLPHIFDRFFRADPARVSSGGSGLGLSIVQSIAETHGGTVEVQSEPGCGSRFAVHLPRNGASSF